MAIYRCINGRNNLNLIGVLVLLIGITEVISQGDEFDYPIKELNLKAAWTNLEFGFPSKNSKECAIDNGLYIKNVGIPFDVAVDYNRNGTRRMFTTIPRLRKGIPYTLAVVTNRQGPNGPILQPYPSYEWHLSHGEDCDGITNVYRVNIDNCDRMWVMDSGEIELHSKCPPQILIFDLKTDQLIHRYRIPKDQYIPHFTQKNLIVVDNKICNSNYDCSNMMAYITDPRANNLIVYDLKKGKSWVVQSRWMYPEPSYGKMTLANDTFIAMEGIYSTVLTPCKYPNRKLYFSILSSEFAYSLPLSLVNNRHAWKNFDRFPNDDAFEIITGQNSQIAATTIDKNALIYTVLFNPVALASWNTFVPLTPETVNVLVYNPKTLQFASGLKVVKNSRGKEEIWVLTNRIQKVNFKRNEIRFRIMASSIKDLVSNVVENFK